MTITSQGSSSPKVAVLTGIISHGQQIPLPEGYTQEECVWFVSLNSWSNTYSDNKYTYDMWISVDAKRVVTCRTSTSGRNGTGGTYSGTANYIIIGVKS